MSGCLIADRLVLTGPTDAAAADASCVVTVGHGTRARHHDARVVWAAHPGGAAHASLVEITDPQWSSPQLRQPLRLGRFVTAVSTDHDGIAAQLVGPTILHQQKTIRLHRADDGTIAIASRARRSHAELTGTAVVCAGALVGITDPATADRHHDAVATVTSLATLATMPGFVATVSAGMRVPPLVEPVDIPCTESTVVPDPVSPDGLLDTRTAAVRYQPGAQWRQLWDWCIEPGSMHDTRILIGADGTGKSRTAWELARRLSCHGEGWAALFVEAHVDAPALATLTRLMVPALIIVDDAENRPVAQLSNLDTAVRAAPVRTRLMLLTRDARVWHDGFSSEPEALADHAEAIRLGRLDADAAHAAWGAALHDLGSRLTQTPADAVTRPEVHAAPPAGRKHADESRRTHWDVQMQALATSLRGCSAATADPTTMTVSDAIGIVSAHEVAHQVRLARRDTRDPRIVNTHVRREIAATTLWSAQTPSRPTSSLLMQHITALALDTDAGTRTAFDARMQQATSKEAEHAIGVICRMCADHTSMRGLLARTLEGGRADTLYGATQAAIRSYDPSPLIDIFRHLTASNDSTQLAALAHAMPEDSRLLASIGLTAAAHLVHSLEPHVDAEDRTGLTDFADALTELSRRQAASGREQAAFGTASRAVTIWNHVAQQDFDAYAPALARAEAALAHRCTVLGLVEKASEAAQRSVEIYRKLAVGNADAYDPDLTRSLDAVAHALLTTGHLTPALQAAQDAARVAERLNAHKPDAYREMFAISLSTLATSLAVSGEAAQALSAAQRAADVYERLADHDPIAYLGDYIESLGVLGARLAAQGQRREAEQTWSRAHTLSTRSTVNPNSAPPT